MATKVITCRNVGCRLSFNSYQQRLRHESKCRKEKPDNKNAILDFTDIGGKYICRKCDVVIVQRNNLKRHRLLCKGRKHLHVCGTCRKIFQYKCKLERHVKQVHQRNIPNEVMFLDQIPDEIPDELDEIPDELDEIPDEIPKIESDELTRIIVNLPDGSTVYENYDDTQFFIDVEEETDEVDDNQIVNDEEEEVDFEDGNDASDEDVAMNDEDSSLNQNRQSKYAQKERIQRSVRNVSQLLNKLNIDEKREVVRKSLEKENDYIVAHSSCKTMFEAKLSNGFLEYIKKLQQKKKQKDIFQMINDIIPDMNDEFLRWIGEKIDVNRKSRFVNDFRRWKSNNFNETRGRKKLSLETMQLITNEWYTNSIPSVDCRNGRETGIGIGIRKSMYMKKYNENLSHEQPLLEKKKRNTDYLQSTRRVLTCTNKKIVELIQEKYNISLPIGTVWYYKPFYITDPTEKEKLLCLCKLCLNKRLQFEALHKRFDEIGDSLSGYLMGSCKCDKDVNGFWKIKCCKGLCGECKKTRLERVVIDVESETVGIKYYQFEETKTTYTCKKTGEEKTSKKVERSADKYEKPSVLLNQLLTKSNDYLFHRYQAQNDKFIWKQVLERSEDPIFHMDYSENLSPTPKFEPQSAHFSKRQFSLHCTVLHKDSVPNKYIYHLSDDTSHDSYFTMAVISDLVRKYAIGHNIIRLKSDNCSTQYKNKYLFHDLRQLAIDKDVKIITYYGVSGHGKGLVDAMSGFGVKTPMRNAIVTEDYFFNSSIELKDYLVSLDLSSDREYFHIENLRRDDDRSFLKIMCCMRQHMIVYFPNGTIQMKENICCCDACFKGDLVKCKMETANLIENQFASDGDIESDIESEGDSENEEDEIDYKMVGDTVYEAVEVGNVVAVYSPTSSSELFYLCEVMEKSIANENERDQFNHIVSKGSPFFICSYLEKIKEKKGEVFYKRVDGTAFVLPYQVFLPSVEISDKLTISSAQYMDLICMI